MNWLIEWLDWFWPDRLIVLWSRLATVLGVIFLLLALVLAVRHYLLGHPLRDSGTQRPLAPVAALMSFLTFGGAGALFLALGILTCRWKCG